MTDIDKQAYKAIRGALIEAGFKIVTEYDHGFSVSRKGSSEYPTQTEISEAVDSIALRYDAKSYGRPAFLDGGVFGMFVGLRSTTEEENT